MKKITTRELTLILALLVLGSISLGLKAGAWTNPTLNPPNGDVTLSTSQWTSGSGLIYYSGGSVGIGTTGPGALLDVKGASTGRTLAGVLSDSTGYGALGFQTTLTAANYALAGNSVWTLINAPSGAPISFNIANNEKMRIGSTGNVGIGTTNPVNILQLGSMGSSGYSGNDLAIGNGTDVTAIDITTGGPIFYTNGNFRFLPSGAGGQGRVGIGMSGVPAEALEVSGNIKLSGASPTYRITNVATPSAASDVATKGYVDAQGSFIETKRVTCSGTCSATATCTSGYYIVYAWRGADSTDCNQEAGACIGLTSCSGSGSGYGQAACIVCAKP